MEKNVVRTLALPIAEVIDGGTKSEFYTDLRNTLDICRTAYNFSISLCAVQDNIHSSHTIIETKKVPTLNKTYNYDKITQLMPGNSAIAASIDRAAVTKYRQDRFQILRGKKSLPVQRSFPLPLLHNKSTQTFVLEIDEQNNLIVKLKLLSNNEYTLKLRGGSNYKYILDRIRFSIEQDNICDSKIWINKKGIATIGIACKVDVKQQTKTNNKISVILGRDVFLSIIKPHSNIPFNITGDQVKKWQSERKRKQERFRQDRKSGIARKILTNIQNRISIKYSNRLKTFIQQTVNHIVTYAIRNKASLLEYDATIRSYFGGDFPYFEFAKCLEDKCQLMGIEFVKVTKDVLPAELDEPHVYFMMSVVNGKPDEKVKIGKTAQTKGKRKRDLETAGGFDLIVLATDKQAKSNLTKREKYYHAMFEKSRLDGQKEWFKLDDVLQYLKETQLLGNSGNLEEIKQFLDV